MFRRFVLSLVTATGLAGLPSASAGDRLGLKDIFEFEEVADPQISPDGERIVYLRRFADIMSDKRYSNLWICNFDGSGHRSLTTGNRNDSSPRWSPDGARLIYISLQGEGTPQIYLRWMDDGQTAKLTNLQTPPSGIGWSPDGKHISFTALVPEDGPGKAIAEIPGPPAGAEWASPARVYDKLNYRFNGAGYYPYGYTHIFVIPSEGGTPRQVSSGEFHHGRRTLAPVWTRDGHLLVSANRRTDHELEPLDTEVWEFSVESGQARALTDRRGPDDTPVVSPDGGKIAYVGFDDRYQGFQLSRLYVMNRDGSGGRILGEDLDRSIRLPQWSPDGKGIYALYDDQGDTKLAYFGLDGRRRIATQSVGRSGTAYSGGSFSISSKGRIAFTHVGPDLPGDVAVVDSSAGRSRRITAVNDDLLAAREIGGVETIRYQSSKDGRPIQGWIIKPPSFDPRRKWPLILEIHGGPFANYGARFDLEKQLMAAGGYVVLYTNPRGSTGYGEEFANLIHHAYPGDDFYDLDSGVDAMVAKGYVDTDNLFVTGGSGGGVLTAWTIGHTDRFRAAVSVYPVINWYSWVLTADISSFGVKYWFPGLPWDHAEHYEKRSLLSVVKNVKTPTMVLTGEADYRTPMSESEQYYQALKLLGVESVLVRVPDEPHGIRVRPSHHLQKLAYIKGWFESHRKKGDGPETEIAGRPSGK